MAVAKARRDADRRLRQAHPDEWDRYFTEARTEQGDEGQ